MGFLFLVVQSACLLWHSAHRRNVYGKVSTFATDKTAPVYLRISIAATQTYTVPSLLFFFFFISPVWLFYPPLYLGAPPARMKRAHIVTPRLFTSLSLFFFPPPLQRYLFFFLTLTLSFIACVCC